jgi:hypothetical protein
MTVTIPADVGYGRIQGQIIRAILDGADGDSLPDGIAAAGSITFTATLTGPAAHESPDMLILPGPYSVNLDNTGSIDVYLVATDDPDVYPSSGWGYKVVFNIIGMTIPSVVIAVPTGSTQNLIELIPGSDGEGDLTLRGPRGIDGVVGPIGPQGTPGTGSINLPELSRNILQSPIFDYGSLWSCAWTGPGSNTIGMVSGVLAYKGVYASGDPGYALWTPPVAPTGTQQYGANSDVCITLMVKGENGRRAFLQAYSWDGSGDQNPKNGPEFVCTGGWQIVSMPYRSWSGGLSSIYVFLRFTDATVGDVAAIHRGQIEFGYTFSGWIDGDKAGCRWLGTPGQSISVRSLIGTAPGWDGIFAGTNMEDRIATQVSALRAAASILGGGVVEWTGGGISWSSRFLIGISEGSGPHWADSGFFQLNMPANGSVIPGVGGHPGATVTGGYIPFAGWDVLYAICDVGASATISAKNLRLASYTSRMLVPSNWVVIAQNDGDANSVKWANGTLMFVGGGIFWPVRDLKRAGIGSPEGVVTADPGTEYINTQPNNGDLKYIKKVGGGNTGWRVSYGDTRWRNISGSLEAGWASGSVYVRRESEMIHYMLSALTAYGAASGWQPIWVAVDGFKSGINLESSVRLNYASGATAQLGIIGGVLSVLAPISGGVPISGLLSVPADQDAPPWPSALPGTP